ncbi:hypothetical protein EDD11_000410, partial [Mortierella claussenii]
FTTIQAHTNQALCPVLTLQEYISRLPSEEDLVPHHKDPTVIIRPLMRDRRNVVKAVGPDTINRHINSIADLIASASYQCLSCRKNILRSKPIGHPRRCLSFYR